MKKSNKWQRIESARKLLQLGDTATINRIKRAYRDLAKSCHPDTTAPVCADPEIDMQELNDAYRALLEYCENYAVPLKKGEEQTDDEDWWMDRFGDDPFWGKGKKK